MTIQTEHYDIISSGSVIVPPGEYLEFEINTLRFRFYFKDTTPSNSAQTNSGITVSLVSDEAGQYLSINVNNFNSLFASPTNMLELGTIEGKALSVWFSIVGLSGSNGEQIKVFHYTWYKSK